MPLKNRSIMMTEPLDIRTLLHSHFSQLAERPLQEEIIEVGKIMHFSAGEIIMNFGSYVRLVPLVVSGAIKVTREDDENGNEILLYYLNAGDSCSMSFTCCMMHKKSIIRTEAMEDTMLIAIPNKYMDVWMNKYASWKNFVMMSYDQRMLEMVKVIDSIAFQKVDERLIQYLKDRSEATNTRIIKATHQEIAFDLNVSREAVSRLLKKLETMGKVDLGRNQVTIKK